MSFLIFLYIHSSFLESVISQLGTEFSILDLVALSFFLGIQVLQQSDGISLSQHKYIQNLLTKAGMKNCKPL
uniref:Reverse transcriptase Ty1/copia-type domain-containing protein n=1 Tax=Solanum lycopersicum TaxID=4081 RepID=A0A3Q7I2W9_SOLLC